MKLGHSGIFQGANSISTPLPRPAPLQNTPPSGTIQNLQLPAVHTYIGTYLAGPTLFTPSSLPLFRVKPANP